MQKSGEVTVGVETIWRKATRWRMELTRRTDLPKLSAAACKGDDTETTFAQRELGGKKQVSGISVGTKNTSITFRCLARRPVCLDKTWRKRGERTKTQTPRRSVRSYKRRAHVQGRSINYDHLHQSPGDKLKALRDIGTLWPFTPFIWFVTICTTENMWEASVARAFFVYVFYLFFPPALL